MSTPTSPQPRRPMPGAAARIAQAATQRDAARRALEDTVLAEADRLGDAAPALIRETAASIRDHREMEARHRERANADGAKLADEEAERRHLEQAAETAAAGLRADADLDRVAEHLDRQHGDCHAPLHADQKATHEVAQEAGR